MKTKDTILLEQAYLKVHTRSLKEDMGYGPDEDPMYGVPQGVEDPVYGDLFDAVVNNVLFYDDGIYTDRKSGRTFKYDEAAGRLVPHQ